MAVFYLLLGSICYAFCITQFLPLKKYYSCRWQKLIKNDTAYVNKAVGYIFCYPWLCHLNFSLIEVYFAVEILLIPSSLSRNTFQCIQKINSYISKKKKNKGTPRQQAWVQGGGRVLSVLCTSWVWARFAFPSWRIPPVTPNRFSSGGRVMFCDANCSYLF